MTLLTPQQLAEALSVSTGVIHRWTKAGTITPEIREGRCIRFDLDNVREQLAKRAKRQPKPVQRIVVSL